MATEQERRAAIRSKAYYDTHRGYEPGTRVQTQSAGEAAAGAYSAGRQGVQEVTYRPAYGPKHLLTAELLLGLIIVLVRIVADYEPQSDGTVKGKVGHPQGQYGPMPIAAGLIASFFVLSFLVAKGGRWATTGTAFGGLIVLVLAMKSTTEFDTVAATFGTWGKGTVPAGNWQTSGDASGDVLSDGTTTTSGSSGGSSQAESPSALAKLKAEAKKLGISLKDLLKVKPLSPTQLH